jgi:hypothetical protein
MATKKQVAANRLNARKSTGPTSPEGKARSAMNALKSGIDAQSHIIRGESEAALQALSAEYCDRFRPNTPEQRMLVDTLIDSEWLLRRFRVCEAQLWERGAQIATTPLAAIVLAQAFTSQADEFTRLQRRVDSAHRNYRHALQELRRLQAEEACDPEPTAPHERASKPRNGAIPQPHAADLTDTPQAPLRIFEMTIPTERRSNPVLASPSRIERSGKGPVIDLA